MTQTRETVNNVCAGILSGIIAPLSWSTLFPLIPITWQAWLRYTATIAGALIVLFLIWLFFNWRQKYAKYKESFKIGYWTGIFSNIFVAIYFYIVSPISRILFLVIVAVIVIVVKLIFDEMKKISQE
jgi:hypothetical protein